MTGFDLLLSRIPSDYELKTALVSSLGLSSDTIELLDDYPLNKLGSGTKVICIKSRTEGDFPLKLSIEVLTDDFSSSLQKIAIKLSLAWGALLIDDGSSNPYRMKLIHFPKQPQLVELNAIEADDGVYRLKGISKLN